MAPARPIHDIFAGLADPAAGDPAAALREGGHGDLPDGLVAEAIVSYAGTAPVEVAEHLAPFVTVHGPVPTTDPDAAAVDVADGLALLTSAPVAAPAEPEFAPMAGEETGGEFGAGELEGSGLDPMDLDFGEGASLVESATPLDADLDPSFEAVVDPTGLDPTGLSPTQPDPEPGEPEPTEPDPSRPGPTEPGPTEPDPGEETFGA